MRGNKPLSRKSIKSAWLKSFKAFSSMTYMPSIAYCSFSAKLILSFFSVNSLFDAKCCVILCVGVFLLHRVNHLPLILNNLFVPPYY